MFLIILFRNFLPSFTMASFIFTPWILEKLSAAELGFAYLFMRELTSAVRHHLAVGGYGVELCVVVWSWKWYMDTSHTWWRRLARDEKHRSCAVWQMTTAWAGRERCDGGRLHGYRPGIQWCRDDFCVTVFCNYFVQIFFCFNYLLNDPNVFFT